MAQRKRTAVEKALRKLKFRASEAEKLRIDKAVVGIERVAMTFGDAWDLRPTRAYRQAADLYRVLTGERFIEPEA